MAKVDNPITYEQLINNLEFKVTKNLLMKEFPWINDVVYSTPDEINKFNLIFLDLVIDPYELVREYGWKIAWYIEDRISRGDFYSLPFLSTIFDSPHSDDIRDLVKEVEKEIKSVHTSAAIPKELRLPDGRQLYLGGVIIDTNLTPKDTTPQP